MWILNNISTVGAYISHKDIPNIIRGLYSGLWAAQLVMKLNPTSLVIADDVNFNQFYLHQLSKDKQALYSALTSIIKGYKTEETMQLELRLLNDSLADVETISNDLPF